MQAAANVIARSDRRAPIRFGGFRAAYACHFRFLCRQDGHVATVQVGRLQYWTKVRIRARLGGGRGFGMDDRVVDQSYGRV